MKAKYGRQSVKGRENMNELSNDTLLSITYGDLKEMLVEFQTDGFNADGCSCSLRLDEDEEVQDEIQRGTIHVLKEGKRCYESAVKRKRKW